MLKICAIAKIVSGTLKPVLTDIPRYFREVIQEYNITNNLPIHRTESHDYHLIGQVNQETMFLDH